MFFMRLRRHARWMFVLLAVIFALSFAFLGVGSGPGGIGDILNNGLPFVGNGSSVPNVVKEAQKKIHKAEQAPGKKGLAPAVLELARAEQARGTAANAEAAYERYIALRPKDANARQELANVYKKEAEAQYQLLLAVVDGVVRSAPFGSTTLGADPIQASVHQNAVAKASDTYNAYHAAKDKELAALQRTSALARGENRASVLAALGQEAGLNDNFGAMRTAYIFSRNVAESPAAATAQSDVQKWARLASDAYTQLLALHKHDSFTKQIKQLIQGLKPFATPAPAASAG
jgi:hypothetical protein